MANDDECHFCGEWCVVMNVNTTVMNGKWCMLSMIGLQWLMNASMIIMDVGCWMIYIHKEQWMYDYDERWLSVWLLWIVNYRECGYDLVDIECKYDSSGLWKITMNTEWLWMPVWLYSKWWVLKLRMIITNSELIRTGMGSALVFFCTDSGSSEYRWGARNGPDFVWVSRLCKLWNVR